MEHLREIEILLVEDNADDIELTLRVLSKINLANSIHIARDGEEALEYIFSNGASTGRGERDKPNIILLDLHLPKVDGLEVLQRIRADERTKMIPVIILTSSTEEEDIIKSYEFNVSSYIVKPIGFDQFIRAASETGLYWMLLSKP
ncbi:MAG: two-component system response regulator [Nitrospirae bacterium RBG_13_43_8]|nr:MAG: two-component system response regulator [Nitrospirae bacterium RBG_13_43_8]